MKGDGTGREIDLEEVDAFAEAAHADQRRFSGEPYIEHPRAVRAILEDEFPEEVDEVTLAIALLHDVLEDSDVHPTILLERWGREVQEGVTLLSWKLRALDIEREPRIYWSGIRRGPRSVRLVKAADRIHNIRDALASRNSRKRKKYLDETERELLPILRDGAEEWMVARLENLLVRLRSEDGTPEAKS
ncbi:MAG TPA: HD domain-containing protein [Gemmatimonadota bacterium]|nr:HD domain-containing protein [Gemmatimonadota bacterium]